MKEGGMVWYTIGFNVPLDMHSVGHFGDGMMEGGELRPFICILTHTKRQRVGRTWHAVAISPRHDDAE